MAKVIQRFAIRIWITSVLYTILARHAIGLLASGSTYFLGERLTMIFLGTAFILASLLALVSHYKRFFLRMTQYVSTVDAPK